MIALLFEQSPCPAESHVCVHAFTREESPATRRGRQRILMIKQGQEQESDDDQTTQAGHVLHAKRCE
jgi:hypothetical protein